MIIAGALAALVACSIAVGILWARAIERAEVWPEEGDEGFFP